MMDFLRSLAPSREINPTRAVAVLPSRFAGETPLRAIGGQARLAHPPAEDEAPVSSDTIPEPEAVGASMAQGHRVIPIQPSQAAPRPPGIDPTRRDTGEATPLPHPPANGRATSPTRPPTEPPIHIADLGTSWDRQGANPERSPPTSPQPPILAATLPDRGPRGVAPPPAQPRAASPLSQSILAQRTPQPRGDRQVVHVTIGRIDVVATTAPMPAVRSSPPPRQETVTLADYLRGGKASRQ